MYLGFEDYPTHAAGYKLLEAPGELTLFRQLQQAYSSRIPSRVRDQFKPINAKRLEFQELHEDLILSLPRDDHLEDHVRKYAILRIEFTLSCYLPFWLV